MRRRTFIAGLAVCAPAIVRAQGLMTLRSGSAAIVVSGGGATTTWNPSDKDANLTLSGGNLVATSAAAAYAGVRAIASASTGKKYWESTLTAIVTSPSNLTAIGISLAAYGLTGFLGSTINSLGWAANGAVYTNGGALASIQAYSTLNDVGCVALDIDNQLIWFRTNGGNWNNNPAADPAAGTNGIAASIGVAATFATCNVGNGGAGDVITTNFGGSAYAQAVPSGYGNW